MIEKIISAEQNNSKSRSNLVYQKNICTWIRNFSVSKQHFPLYCIKEEKWFWIVSSFCSIAWSSRQPLIRKLWIFNITIDYGCFQSSEKSSICIIYFKHILTKAKVPLRSDFQWSSLPASGHAHKHANFCLWIFNHACMPKLGICTDIYSSISNCAYKPANWKETCVMPFQSWL